MKRILIIEDNTDIRENLEEYLMLCDFDVVIAQDGEVGLAKIQEKRPHLILCDIAMPKMDGFQVLEQIKSDKKTATIPFVFITSSAQKKDLEKGMSVGADAYLTKPFQMQELTKVIDQFVNETVTE